MSAQAAAALALLAAAAAPFDLPPLPRPDEGYAALWGWLQAVNAELSIPDAEFRWWFGGISIPILLLLELAGIRKDWKLYPFLLPFWLVFGGVALGVVGGVAVTAAHLVLFPVGRIWFLLRDRQRRREAEVAAPAPRASPAAARTTRPAQDVLRAALEAFRAAAERQGGRPAAGAPGKGPEPTWGAILRALGAALTSAAGAQPADRAQAADHGQTVHHGQTADHGQTVHRAPGQPPPLPDRPTGATGAAPGKPDFSAFRPDPARFRRRLPKG